MKKIPLIYWLPVPLYYAFITFLSGTSPSLPSENWPVANLDKIFHFVEYSFFGLVLARDLFWQKFLLQESRSWPLTFAVFLAILIPLDEMHQYFTPGRHFDWIDAVADMSGAFVGAAVYVFAIRGYDLSVETHEGVRALKERDARNFSVFLALIMLFIVVTVNVLSIKEPVEARSPVLGTVFDLVEWGVLGYFNLRAVFLVTRPRRFKTPSWIALALLFAADLAVYGAIVSRLQKAGFADVLSPLFAAFFACGLIVKIGKIAFGELRRKIAENPAHRRETLQRAYYFYLPAVLTLGIGILSTLPARAFSPHWAADGTMEYPLYFILFFLLGVMGFRAVSWECWWHEASRKKWIWAASVSVLLFTVAGNEVLKGLVARRHAGALPALANAGALALALFLYLTGYSFAQSEAGRSPKKRPFYARVKETHGEHDKCA